MPEGELSAAQEAALKAAMDRAASKPKTVSEETAKSWGWSSTNKAEQGAKDEKQNPSGGSR